MRTTRPDVSVETSHGPARASSLLVLSALLAACSGSSSGPNSGDLVVQSCSLGCTSGAGGQFVSCAVGNITENQEISVLFSEPVDPASLNTTSFQITDADNGTAPEGLRFVDPLDPRRVVFRPALTFEVAGVSFSFERNRDYEVLIPGEAQGDVGPFIRSIAGRPNQSRLSCEISTTEGLADLRPGNPGVQVFADAFDEVDPVTGEGIGTAVSRVQLSATRGDAPVGIAADSNIYFEFNELMFLPTVAINGSGGAPGVSPFITVEVDNDDNLATAGSDRVTIPGSYEVSVDQVAQTTTLVFTPAVGLPSSGVAPLNILVVSIPTQVTDIAGNPVTALTGGGFKLGVPENIFFAAQELPTPGGDPFDDTGFLQDEATGAVVTGGRLEIGLSGGSGRHGELVIPDGETVVLSTDSQIFPLAAGLQIDVVGNPDLGGAYPTSETVTDGVFEFSKLIMGSGSRLEIGGAVPARILVRGECDIAQGAVIDIAGESAPATHSSLTPMNSVAPAPGPGGGAGGIGADRADATGLLANQLAGAIENPGAVRDGEAGGPIGGAAGAVGAGGGGGGAAYPFNLPTNGSGVINASYGDNGDGGAFDGTAYTIAPDVITGGLVDSCIQLMSASPGAGGALATAGGPATGNAVVEPTADWPTEDNLGNPIGPIPNAGPVAAAGDNSALMLPAPDPSGHTETYGARFLDPRDGNLVGGGGGGGGGNHTFGTLSDGGVPNPVTMASQCEGAPFPGTPVTITRWLDHSAASGGAGGGAIEITAGDIVRVRGSILAFGGDGGSALATTQLTELGRFAAPGGGGAGGGVRIQGRDVEFSAPGSGSNVDISGGAAGLAPWSNITSGVQQLRGGVGSTGLMRVADNSGTITLGGVAERVTPSGPNNSIDFLSVEPGGFDANEVGTSRPYTLSGATSCWFKPTGTFFSLTFNEENVTNGLAWNMDVVFADGSTRPYRELAGGPASWEDDFGNTLGGLPGVAQGSPIVVRFQGGRSSALADPCNVDPNDENSGIEPGSLTPWVQHPEELLTVTDAFGQTFSFNMIRYCVIFDRTVDGLDTPGTTLTNLNVVGVDNVRITVQPE